MPHFQLKLFPYTDSHTYALVYSLQACDFTMSSLNHTSHCPSGNHLRVLLDSGLGNGNFKCQN